jgi:hypothetical protein
VKLNKRHERLRLRLVNWLASPANTLPWNKRSLIGHRWCLWVGREIDGFYRDSRLAWP